MNALKTEAKERMLAGVKADPVQFVAQGQRADLNPNLSQLIDQGYNQNRAHSKLAETFNTNHNYISEAQRLKTNNPAAVAVEAEEIVKALKAEAKERQVQGGKGRT